jgi:NAD(P)-dependent dehydrogenase (short-subunit alcohol dehydrogenase family)
MSKIMITGAGSGLNKGAALELVKRGHAVIACVEDYVQRRALELEARTLGAKLQIEKLDVTQEGDRKNALTWNVDVLVNGAGILEGGALVDIPAENVQRQFEVNVFGPLQLTQGIARQMVARRDGRIVFVSSVVGILVGPFVGAYGATKHAIEAIAQTMALELQEFGVRVSTINPGPYLTGFNDAGFLAPQVWNDDPAARVFDYGKLAFPFEQIPPETVFGAMADVIEGKSPLMRNVVAPEMADGVRQASAEVWTRKVDDGLGTRPGLVQLAYAMKPETPVKSS